MLDLKIINGNCYINGKLEKAEEGYNNILPLINYENRQCGFRGAKYIFKEGGIIGSDLCRHPIEPLPDSTKKGLLKLAKNYDLIALNWGK